MPGQIAADREIGLELHRGDECKPQDLLNRESNTSRPDMTGPLEKPDFPYWER